MSEKLREFYALGLTVHQMSVLLGMSKRRIYKYLTKALHG